MRWIIYVDQRWINKRVEPLRVEIPSLEDLRQRLGSPGKYLSSVKAMASIDVIKARKWEKGWYVGYVVNVQLLIIRIKRCFSFLTLDFFFKGKSYLVKEGRGQSEKLETSRAKTYLSISLAEIPLSTLQKRGERNLVVDTMQTLFHVYSLMNCSCSTLWVRVLSDLVIIPRRVV